MKRGTCLAITILCLVCTGGCNRQPDRNNDPPNQPIVEANNNPPKDDTKPGPQVVLVLPRGDKEPNPKKAEPAPKEDNELWPEISDEPPTEPKPLDPKVLDAWKAAGAKAGWQTQVQQFDKKPDFKSYPEMLPYLSLRPFKSGAVAKLPAPDEPFSLYLDGSDITDAGVRELATLKKLRKLELSVNYALTGAGFADLGKLPDLRILRLYQTKVDDAGLKEICQIKSLSELDVGVTAVTEAGLTELTRLKRLQILRIWNVKLTDAGLKTLARCQNLRELTMSRLHQTGAGLESLGRLKKLESVSMHGVYGMSLKDADLKGIGSLQNLRYLNLSSNAELSDDGLAELGNLKKLRFLALRGTKITAAGLKHLSGLQELEHLVLTGNRISDAGLEHLAKLKNLKTLEVGGTDITDAGLKVIVAFESERLQSVHLPAKVTKAARDEAKKLRPKVSFSH
jgi:Leucine-rich repeat (LRR) protein